MTESELDRIRQRVSRRDEDAKEHERVQSYFDGRRTKIRTELLDGRMSPGTKIIDVGCGEGDWLLALCEEGVKDYNLYGIDQSEDRCDKARRKVPRAHIASGWASQMQFADGTFDGVILSLVLSSIHDSTMQQEVIDEAWRLVAPGGWMLVHDLSWSRPGGDAQAVSFGRVKRMLNGEPEKHEKYSLILFPPLARLFAPWALGVVQLLECFPFLRGHWMARFDKELE